MSELGDDAEIVGDDHDSHAEFGLQPLEEIEDLCLDRDVERGRGLVGQEHFRVAGEGDGDHHPLPHAARELVRVGVEPLGRCWNSDLGEELDGPSARRPPTEPLVPPERLGDLVADREDRVQGGRRLLEDHRDRGPADALQFPLGQAEEIAPLEQHSAAGDPPRRLRHEAEDRKCGHALAAARLADDAQHFSRVEVEGHAVDRNEAPPFGRQLRREVPHRENRGPAHGYCCTLRRGSSTSLSPSPNRLSPSTVIARARPGTSVIQGASRM